MFLASLIGWSVGKQHTRFSGFSISSIVKLLYLTYDMESTYAPSSICFVVSAIQNMNHPPNFSTLYPGFYANCLKICFPCHHYDLCKTLFVNEIN